MGHTLNLQETLVVSCDKVVVHKYMQGVGLGQIVNAKCKKKQAVGTCDYQKLGGFNIQCINQHAKKYTNRLPIKVVLYLLIRCIHATCQYGAAVLLRLGLCKILTKKVMF